MEDEVILSPEEIAARNGWVRHPETGRWVKEIGYEICEQCQSGNMTSGARDCNGQFTRKLSMWQTALGTWEVCGRCGGMGVCLGSVNRRERELLMGNGLKK